MECNGKNTQELKSMRSEKKEMRKDLVFSQKRCSKNSVSNSHDFDLFSTGYKNVSHTKGYNNKLNTSCMQTRD